jgi:hypothetical protein
MVLVKKKEFLAIRIFLIWNKITNFLILHSATGFLFDVVQIKFPKWLPYR